jgi:penicillin-binding protein 2
MIQPPPDDRRPPLTPQLALRVAVLGGFALTMFAIIFFRLWYLQVLSGQQYLKEASVNVLRAVDVPAPRGDILDVNGNVLVTSRSALDVQIAPPDMPVPVTTANMYAPPRKDALVYRRLAAVLNISTKPVRHGCRLAEPALAGVKPKIGRYRLAAIPCQVAQSVYRLPFQNVTIRRDVSPDVQYYLAEREEHFPGVIVEKVYVRSYPLGGLAAQLFGTIGPITPQEVKERRFKGVSQNAVIGQSGLEAAYDRYLRGLDGSQRIQVNSVGQFQKYLRGTTPIAGHDLQLSLDINLQRAGQSALAQSIASNPPSNGGAFIAMNPDTGAIYAMGSLPTFDPNIFAKPVSEAAYKALNNPSSNYPLFNRAIDGGGPTGSTFKPITATAALESGVWSVGQTYDDTGQFCEGTLCRRNAGGVANGVLDLVNALRVSDDVFFYNLGALTNADPFTHPNGGALQHWAHEYGIGEPTGVDLPGEATGTLPSPAWRADRNKLEAECDSATGPYRYTNGQTVSAIKHPGWYPSPKHAPGGCGIADGTNRPWSVGDNVNLAVGQGDVQVTPLQLAVAYSAIANGGTIVRPHVGLAVTAANGTVLQKIQPPATRHIAINPSYLATIRQGLHEAAQSPGGTSFDVMGNFPEPVYGKTGTAQYNGQQDYSWYSCFVPSWGQSQRPPIEVVVWVQQGGFGAVAAAPVAREILSQWFTGKRGQYIAGKSTTL